MSTVKKIVDNIYRIPGNASLEDIYQATSGKLLPVEPFSKKQTIADFLLEGGTGYNSMLNGSLGEHIYEIRASYNGRKFTYGLPFSTLYATGYPLQRIIEGSKTNTLIGSFDRIDYVTLPLSDAEDLAVLWKQSSYEPFDPPPFAINVLYLNAQGAKLLGAKNGGFLIVIPGGREPAGEGWEVLEHSIWENRFFIDHLGDTTVLTVFTQKSTSAVMHAAYQKQKLSGLFMALFTKKGVLVKIAGAMDELDTLWQGIKDQPYTYKLG
jgi:hypothetical protein